MAFYDGYHYEDYRTQFDVADGDHRVTVVQAREAQAKSGRAMIEVTLKVEGATAQYIERYVDNEFFNKNISRFFDAFGMKPGNFQFASWANRTATAHFEHEQDTYTGSDGLQRNTNRAKLKYLIVPEREQFPAYQNPPAQGGYQQGAPQGYQRQGYAQTQQGAPNPQGQYQRPPVAQGANTGAPAYAAQTGGFPEDIPF